MLNKLITLLCFFLVSASISSRSQYDVSLIDVYDDKSGSYTYYAINPNNIPLFITLRPLDRKNLTSRAPLPAEVVIPAKSKVKVIKLTIMNRKRPHSTKFDVNVSVGNPKAIHSNPKYLHPFKKKSFKITQGFMGRATHNATKESRYAIDIAMPVGTPLMASRGGIVTAIEQRYSGSGLDPSFLRKANFIEILHTDGTISNYGHIDTNSAKVKEGQQVNAGQIIALSGNVGYSSGPHLHFSVIKNTRNAGGGRMSIPFVYTSGKPKVGKILQGL
jgi:murein DD-endopeptidase MepM/ murein hydrolase activator NlpD